MCLEVGRVDHDGLRAGACGSQPLHHLEENTLLSPALPPVVQRLMRAVILRRIAPPQPVPIDENNAVQHPPVINPRFAMALGRIWLEPRHLIVRQPILDRSCAVSSRSLNQMAALTSMGPDPWQKAAYPLKRPNQNTRRPEVHIRWPSVCCEFTLLYSRLRAFTRFCAPFRRPTALGVPPVLRRLSGLRAQTHSQPEGESGGERHA